MRKIKYLFSAIVVVLMCCMAAMANEVTTLDDYIAYTSHMIADSGVQAAAVDEGDITFGCKRLLVEFSGAAYLPDVIRPIDYVLYKDIGVYAFATKAETEMAYKLFNSLTDVENVLIDKVITLNTSVEEVNTAASIGDITSQLETKNWGIGAVRADIFKEDVAAQDPGEVVVGIIDTGLATNHTYFKDSPRVIGGVNLAENGKDLTDYNGHGTHVAGIVMASTPENVKIRMYQIFGETPSATSITLNSAVLKAIEDGVDVINMSLESSCAGALFHNSLEVAYENGIIIVAAAGNGGDDEKADPVTGICPAHYSEHLITVGAVDSEFKIAPYSNYGAEVDISAPGTKIYSTYLPQKGTNEGYATMTGTSMAAPFVASYAAMLKSLDSTCTFEDICLDIKEGAFVPADWDNTKNGAGILSMSHSVTLIENIITHKSGFVKNEELNELDFELQVENKTADPVRIYMHFAFLNDKGIQIGSHIATAKIMSNKKPTVIVPMETIPEGTDTIKGYAWTEDMEPVSMGREYKIPVEE